MRTHEVVRESSVVEIVKSTSVTKDYSTPKSFRASLPRAVPTKIKIKGYPIYWDEKFNALLVKDPSAEQFLGMLHLQPLSKFGVESSVFFTPELQGKGIAVPLYAAAIKQLGHTIVSDSHQSRGSTSLWAKLSKVPGIFVYGWGHHDNDENDFFQWDPDVDPSEEMYYDPDDAIAIKKELADTKQSIYKKMEDGQMDISTAKKEIDDATLQAQQQLSALHRIRDTDVRLVATATKGLDKQR